VRYVPDGSLCTASAEQIFPRDRVQRNCFEFALYTPRDHDCISNRIGSGIRNCPRCRCRLATFGALPTSSMIDRAIIMLNDHRFWGHASGPSSSSGKTLSSFHPLLARPCRSALPRERFSPLALLGHVSFRFGADSLLNPYFRDFSRSLRKPAGAFSALAGGLRPQGAQLCRGRGP